MFNTTFGAFTRPFCKGIIVDPLDFSYSAISILGAPDFLLNL